MDPYETILEIIANYFLAREPKHEHKPELKVKTEVESIVPPISPKTSDRIHVPQVTIPQVDQKLPAPMPKVNIVLSTSGKQITDTQVVELTSLLFGVKTVGAKQSYLTSRTSFNPEWIQGMYFPPPKDIIQYGLVQAKGGPCGILAVVNAFVVKHLMFENCKKGEDSMHPSKEKQKECLHLAISDILWQASPGAKIKMMMYFVVF